MFEEHMFGRRLVVTISRVRAVWTGFVGAPGYTSMYFAPESTGIAAAVRKFFDDIKTQIPSVCTVQVESSGDNINEADGSIVGSWSEAPVLPVVGGGIGIYSAPSGSVIRWTTAGIVNGRRVKGRTFIVPLDGDAYDSSGTLTAAAITLLNTGADNLIGDVANQLCVWARPFPGSVGQPARAGTFHIVSGRVVPDKAAVLRSRRD